MSFDLPSAALRWDVEYAATLTTPVPEDSRPYFTLLDNLRRTAFLRYQPYQNDILPDYFSKLIRWLPQFPESDQSSAFLLATKIVFITLRQFESLQRHLFCSKIRRLLLDSVLQSRGLPAFNYSQAIPFLNDEMNATLFVGNSDSSHINDFVHINSDFFADRSARNLVGPDVRFWTYPQERMPGLNATERVVAEDFETSVLKSDHQLRGKRRLVVIEDFSGSGSDLKDTIDLLRTSTLPFEDVVIAPVLITAAARERLEAHCTKASQPGKRFSLTFAFELGHKFRCFATPVRPLPVASYLSGGVPQPDLHKRVLAISDWAYVTHFQHAPGSTIENDSRHGFGGLALAFAFYTNIPDNSLPLLWTETSTFAPLFKRASRIL
jgi:hypothetical protein